MKIYVGMGAADINSILIVREGNLGRYCVRIKNVRKRDGCIQAAPITWLIRLGLAIPNLITLCEASGNHHLWTGHLGDFKSWNVYVRDDASTWNRKIKGRPYN